MPGLIGRSHLLSPVVGIITALAASTAAQAQSTFDGLWRVQIVLKPGYAAKVIRPARSGLCAGSCRTPEACPLPFLDRLTGEGP